MRILLIDPNDEMHPDIREKLAKPYITVEKVPSKLITKKLLAEKRFHWVISYLNKKNYKAALDLARVIKYYHHNTKLILVVGKKIPEDVKKEAERMEVGRLVPIQIFKKAIDRIIFKGVELIV